MLRITTMLDGTYECEARSAKWRARTRMEAIHSLIKHMRTCCGEYVREGDIMFYVEAPKKTDKEDKMSKYRITDEECEMIIKIREGDLVVLKEAPVPPPTITEVDWSSFNSSSRYGDDK